MQSSQRIMLGVFIVVGVLLFALGLFWIGDRRQLFSDSIELQANFQNVSGLARGAQVRVAGLDAGEVLNVGVPLQPGAPFRVRFRVTANLENVLRTDSVAGIQTDGLVGNKFLNVSAGTAAAPPAEDGDTIRSREPIEIGDLIEQVSDLADAGFEAVEDVRGGVNETIDTVIELNTETTAFIETVHDRFGSISDTALAITRNVEGMVADVRQGQGSIGKILTDDALYQDMRSTVTEAHESIENIRLVSEDLQQISSGFREIELEDRIDRVAANIEELTGEATEAIRSFSGTFEGTAGPGGLVADLRQTIDNTNRVMANMRDNTEALKRNWFFRGFFNDRGFYNIDTVGLEDYLSSRFLAERQRITRRLDAPPMFDPQGLLTPTGRAQINTVMAEYLKYSREDPLMIEAYAAGGGTDTLLQARNWAISVREYVVGQFGLLPSYVGIMPMRSADLPESEQHGDGVALVLFAARGR